MPDGSGPFTAGEGVDIDERVVGRLAMVARALTNDIEVSDVIRLVVNEGMSGLEASGGVLALTTTSGYLLPIATCGPANNAMVALGRLNLDRALPITVAARDGEPVWVGSRRVAIDRFPDLAAAFTASQAWAAIPMFHNGAVFCVLGLSFATERDFSAAERSFLQTLADLTALAVGPIAATVAANDIEVAVLDASGVIMEVNDAWRRFGLDNGGDPTAGVGRSYLEICDRAGDDPSAVEMGHTIRRALLGEFSGTAALTVPCHSPTEERWFEVIISPRRDDDGTVHGAVVSLNKTASRRSGIAGLGLDDELSPTHTSQILESLDVAGRHQRDLERETASAVSQERERLARDIHDDVIQDVFATSIMLEGLAALVPDPVRARIEALIDNQDALMRRLRQTVFNLTTPATSGGVQGAVTGIVSAAARTLGFAPSLTIIGEAESVDDDVLLANLLMALRETLSNVARHADATVVDIEMRASDVAIELEVRDDGVGLRDDSPRHGHGLANLEHRAEGLGGRCTITTPPEGGTVVTWSVPRTRAQPAARAQP